MLALCRRFKFHSHDLLSLRILSAGTVRQSRHMPMRSSTQCARLARALETARHDALQTMRVLSRPGLVRVATDRRRRALPPPPTLPQASPPPPRALNRTSGLAHRDDVRADTPRAFPNALVPGLFPAWPNPARAPARARFWNARLPRRAAWPRTCAELASHKNAKCAFPAPRLPGVHHALETGEGGRHAGYERCSGVRPGAWRVRAS